MSEILPDSNSSADSSKDQKTILDELRITFEDHRTSADQRARRSRRWAPILAVIAALGSAFAGAAVATTSLPTSWRTAVIIVSFFSTGIAAGAAALRPTEKAQAAVADLANAQALCAWVDFLTLQLRLGKIDDSDFDRAVIWLQTWRIHQLKPEPYSYDGRLPWTEPAAARVSSADEKGAEDGKRRGVRRSR
jgi:hypothetical protein